MNAIYFIELYQYNLWNNRRVWECLMALEEQQVHQTLAADEWTLFQHCLHIIAVEDWWIRFLQTGEVHFIKRAPLRTRADLRRQWDQTEEMVTAYIATLSVEELRRLVRPPFWDDDQQAIHVDEALTQVLFHSADHRSQMLSHIRTLGGPTVEQDYLQYLRATEPNA